MRKSNKQNTFLAGVAALALFTATGAFAQQGQPDQKGGGAGMKAPSGMQSQRSEGQGGMSNPGAQSEPVQGAAMEKANVGEKTPSPGNRNAQELNNNNKGAGAAERDRREPRNTAQPENDRSRSAQSKTTRPESRSDAQSEDRNRGGGAGTAQRNESRPKGLQANTRLPMQGANVTLNEQQRTQIRDTIINGHDAPRVGSVDFDVSVGTVVPRGHLHLVPVPEVLVQIDPGWRGFLYFVYNDQVIIVDPHDMRIIEVLPV